MATRVSSLIRNVSLTACLLAFIPGLSHAYEVHDGPTGVIKYERAKAYNGYTLFTPTEENTKTYLIDMKGDVVHTWQTKADVESSFVSRLLPNGNLMVYSLTKDAPVKIGGSTGLLEELDWDGNVVWSYKMSSPDEVSHHAFDRMPNGNTLILGWERVTADQFVKKGRKAGTWPDKPIMLGGRETKDFWIDFVREVDEDGKTVWEWHAMDHLGTGPDQLDANYTLPKKVGIGYASYDWSHFNTLEYLPETDQILMNSRNLSESFIVDRKTGKIVFRWGNPSTHGKGKMPSWYDDGDQKLFGSHHATLLDNGNLSIFDNGSERPEGSRSRVVEVDMKTGDIVWEYKANGYNSFFSYRQGAAQRLPNGNTLVTSTQQGHLFEVTKDGEVVWEFVNPIMKGKSQGIFSDRVDVLVNKKGEPLKNMFNNMVHRAYRYGPDFPGLKDKELKSQGYIVEGYPRFFEIWHKQ